MKFCYNLFVMFLIEPFEVIMDSIIVSMLHYIEASRGAGAQACDFERDSRRQDLSHGNKIFNVFVSSLW